MFEKWLVPQPEDKPERVYRKLQRAGLLTGLILVVVLAVLSQAMGTSVVLLSGILMILGIVHVNVRFIATELLRNRDSRRGDQPNT